MLNWMFNRQKSKDDGALDDKSAAKLRDLAETVRSIAPDEFGAAEQANSRAPRIPRKKDSDGQLAQSGLDYAARLSADLADDDEDEDGQKSAVFELYKLDKETKRYELKEISDTDSNDEKGII